MSRAESTLLPESSLPSDEKPKTRVLLTDSDGTIFHGNMKNVISTVIRFLKKTPDERGAIDELFTQLGDDLPEETQKRLRPWLEKQESIPWAKPARELATLQQTIAGFFPLIEYQDTDLDAKTSCSALDVFKAVWARAGRVMILTFNIYAPHTLRHALIKQGLSEEQARQITIICPGSDTIPDNEQIYACEPPGGGELINKNGYIREAQRICREELKLTDCEYIFVDDCHARAAQSKSLDMSVAAITGEYADGQHWEQLLTLVKDQQFHTPALSHSSPGSPVFDIGGEVSTPVLDFLRFRSESGSLSLEKSTREIPALELPPPIMGSTSSMPHIPSNPYPFSPWPPRTRGITAPESSASSSSSFFSSTLSTDEKSSWIMSQQLTFSSRLGTPARSPRRVDSSRQERSGSGLDLMASFRERNNSTIQEIVGETEETTEVKQPFKTAYTRAEGFKQKMEVIIRAIEHFYPQIFNTLESLSVRFNGISPRWELQQWIQKLDALYIDCQPNTPNQIELIGAATACWLTLQRASSSISRDTREEIPSLPLSSLMDTELKKWSQRQLALTSSVASPTRMLNVSYLS